MVSTYSSSLRLDLQGTGDNNGTWGTVANTDFSLIDSAIAGYVTVSVSGGNTTLSTNNGSADQARMGMIEVVGSPTSAANIIIPSVSKNYFVRCSLSNGQTATVKVSGSTGYSLVNSATQYVITDGVSVTGPSAAAASGVVSGTYGLVRADINSYGIITSASETVSTTGIVTRTGSNTYVTRSVSAGAGVTVTNPTGASGDFIVGLSAVGTSATYANIASLAVDTYGRVTAVVSSTGSDISVRNQQILTAIVTCAQIPADNTLPQISEGTQVFTATITPQRSTSTMRIRAVINGGNASSSGLVALALFKDSNANAIAVTNGYLPAASLQITIPLEYYESSGSTSSRTYSLRCGAEGAANFAVNCYNGSSGNKYGTTTCYFVVEEIG